jgi:hypothetical protein
MDRQDVQLLQNANAYPSLSITMPTHRTAPGNRQDPLRLRSLVAQATDRLLSEFSRRDLEPLFARLDALLAEIDWRKTLDGLALYVSRDVARSFVLPFDLKERVVVDHSFYTRDLVYALNHSPRYWVLVLSEKPTRLLEGLRETLAEATGGGFPMVFEGPGEATELIGGLGVSKSAYRDERHRYFFRQVDAALATRLATDRLPLVLVGVDRFLAFFNEVTAHQDVLLTTLTGSHDRTSAYELGQLVWPLVQTNLAHRRRKALDTLDVAVGAQRSVSTIGEVWRMAQDGRGRTLLVEDDYHAPARVDASGRNLTLVDDATSPDVMDDAVDNVIETVLSKGGEVVFVDNGSLASHGRIAMILRY